MSGSKDLNSWTPIDLADSLAQLDLVKARYSRGFLRCQLDRWLPAMAGQWLPIMHSFGLGLEVVKVETALHYPQDIEDVYIASFEGGDLGLVLDSASLDDLIGQLTPGVSMDAAVVVKDYLARRFITSMAMAWGGPGESKLVYRGLGQLDPEAFIGAVNLTANLNGQPVTLWVLLAPALVDRFDSLWKKQVRSLGSEQGSGEVELVLALGLVPESADLFSRSKASKEEDGIMRFDSLALDKGALRVASNSWLPVKLYNAEGFIAFEVLSGSCEFEESLDHQAVLEIGRFKLDQSEITEATQVGAMHITPIKTNSKLNLTFGKKSRSGLELVESNDRVGVKLGS